jgi:ATP synthase protein I
MAKKDKSDSPAETASLSMRIRQLEESRKPERHTYNRAALPSNGLAMAGRVTTELVGGLVVGTGVGWALDQWLDTSPVLMVVMFFLGAAAGMMNVWRALTGRGMAAGFFDEKRQAGQDDPSPDEKSRSD